MAHYGLQTLNFKELQSIVLSDCRLRNLRFKIKRKSMASLATKHFFEDSAALSASDKANVEIKFYFHSK